MAKIEIRGLSLHRPWPWAMLHFVNPDEEYDIGPKRVENRGWPFPEWRINQYVALHAAKRWDEEARQYLIDEFAVAVPPKTDTVIHPEGVIYAVARIIQNITHVNECPGDQLAWFCGPYGWLLEDFTPIAPVSCVGQQGLFELPTNCPKHGNVYEAVREAYKTALVTPYVLPTPTPTPATPEAPVEVSSQPEQKGLF